MDFGALPPEINSGLMYLGPGSGPMVAVATAWDNLASQLTAATGTYSSVISQLTSEWRGPSSTSMVGAAAPYAAWMRITAMQVEQTAAQARAAASAYEAAFAMTVPPPVIAANRSLLMSLVATNFLGQNTAAIAATEAQYGEMWARDAVAMYGYAADSAAASAVTPFTPAPQTTNPAAQVMQAAASVQSTGTSTATNMQTELSQLLSAVPTALQNLASPTSAASSAEAMMGAIGLEGADLSSPAGILDFLAGADGSPLGAFLNDNFLNTIFSSGFYMPGNFLGTMTDFVGMGSGGAAAADAGAGAAEGAAAGAGSVEAGLAATVSPLGATGLGGAVSGGLGQASSVGALSVPYGWTTAAPEIQLAAEALPSSGLSAAPAIAAGGEGSMFSELALASMAGRAMSGTSMGGRPVGVTAPENRPLPIVIVRPPQLAVGNTD